MYVCIYEYFSSVLFIYIGKEHPDLKQLINVLKPTTSGVATRWYDIGLQLLDCEVGVLDVIKCDNPQNNEACCRNMLMEWLHRQPNASWDQLVLALSNVGMNVVADQVKTVFHQGITACAVHTYLSTSRFQLICDLVYVMYLIQNIQAVKKECGPQKGYGKKRCEIQGGGQEMAVMVG